MKIVDNKSEQHRLEELLEETKPPIPEACSDLNYLLFTPFRYKPPHNGSRFRREGQTEGAFYASEKIETALAEISFYRLLFYTESPDTPLPLNPCPFQVFPIKYASDRSIDLTIPPLNTDQKYWEIPNDNSYCQEIADHARANNINVIRSSSVRCPEEGKNITILSCDAFAEKAPKASKFESWRLIIKKDRAIAVKECRSSNALSFTKESFSNDPRMK